MKPWWLRPLAEGDEGEASEEPPPSAPKQRAPAKQESAPAEAAPRSQGATGGSRKSPSDGRRRSEQPKKEKEKEKEKEKDKEKEKEKRERPERSERKDAPPRAAKEEPAAAKRSSRGSDKSEPERGSRGGRGRGRAEQHDDKDSESPLPRRRRRAYEDTESEPHDSNGSASERSPSVNAERRIAIFCDLENVALGVRDSKEVNKFDINLVLTRLLEKGKVIIKKAYCDWERYSEFKRPFHEAAIEMIDIPQKYYSGKNSADIKMVVDAMDYCYSKDHLDTFAILSGDSDFSPLVSKLRESNKYVIGVGVKGSSSNLLIANCDEFIYYEDVWRDQQQGPRLDGLSKKENEAFGLMVDAIQALIRDNKDVLWGSMVKQTMQRKRPSFSESYYGYSSFSDLLEDAEDKGIVQLKKDRRSGTYIVTGFASQR